MCMLTDSWRRIGHISYSILLYQILNIMKGNQNAMNWSIPLEDFCDARRNIGKIPRHSDSTLLSHCGRFVTLWLCGSRKVSLTGNRATLFSTQLRNPRVIATILSISVLKRKPNSPTQSSMGPTTTWWFGTVSNSFSRKLIKACD